MPRDPAGRLTAVFAKYPHPGAVKTRLVPFLSPEQAAELALAMLDDTLAKLAPASEFSTALVLAPAEALAWARERYPRLARIEPQVGAGLGERMARFFDVEWLARPAGTTVIVGSDAPLLAAGSAAAAHRALERGAELVLALDSGGGYALIGLARPAPELFERVAMSSADMAERTLGLAKELGLATELLEPASDVDWPADVLALARRLAELPRDSDFPHATARVLAALGLADQAG